MSDRRTFLWQTGLAVLGLGLSSFNKFGVMNVNMAPATPAIGIDEDFWLNMRQQYLIPDDFINLNNGGVSPQPIPVQTDFIEKYQFSNQGPTYYMWEKLDGKHREPLRQRMANMAGCSPEELAFVRNTTEAMNNIIFGLNLKAGDEVVASSYDYPFVDNAWRQRVERDGIVWTSVELNPPEEDDDAIVRKYEAAITAKTKVVNITYVLNWTGQILPVRRIADIAHSKGCLVLVDAAHAFAQIPHQIPDTGADFYATSLHKWLGAPFGSGLLYIKQNLIQDIWPLHSDWESRSGDIRKFESQGTRNMASEMAIDAAMDFHETMGTQIKYNRLVYLKQYWLNQVKDLPRVTLYTSDVPERSCGLASIAIAGYAPEEIVTYLFEQARIHVCAVERGRVQGIRVTPNVYTTTHELDILVKHIKELAS